MKVTLNWLREYVDFDWSPEQLAERLTMLGIEVEGVEKQTGESCASGIAVPGDPLLSRVTQDWLNEFERVQWLLRLSPRLRQKHRD